MPDAKPPIRSTRRNRRILLVLLSEACNLGGITICHAAGVPSGTVHPTLAKLEAAGWVDSTWGPARTAPGRRRLYHLTLKGRRHAMEMLGLEEGEF